jgi:hypothetical protein
MFNFEERTSVRRREEKKLKGINIKVLLLHLLLPLHLLYVLHSSRSFLFGRFPPIDLLQPNATEITRDRQTDLGCV